MKTYRYMIVKGKIQPVGNFIWNIFNVKDRVETYKDDPGYTLGIL